MHLAKVCTDEWLFEHIQLIVHNYHPVKTSWFGIFNCVQMIQLFNS